MTVHVWRHVVAASVLLGMATAIGPYVGMLLGLWIGVYMVAAFGLATYSVPRRTYMLFAVILVSVAVFAAVVYIGACAVLGLAGIASSSGQSLDFQSAFWLHIMVIGLGAAAFGFALRALAWRKRSRK